MGKSGLGDRGRRFVGSGAGLVGAAVLSVALLAGGGAALTDRISAGLLQQDAEAEALAWAADLSANLPDLPALIEERRAPSPEASAWLAMARNIGGVFRYKVFDRRGDLVFVSDDLDQTAPGDAKRDLASHRGPTRWRRASSRAGRTCRPRAAPRRTGRPTTPKPTCPCCGTAPCSAPSRSTSTRPRSGRATTRPSCGRNS